MASSTLTHGAPRAFAAWCALTALLLAGLLAPTTARADFPGQNGKILFRSGGDLWTVNPDGTGAANLTSTGSTTETRGSWSPDGAKVALVDGTSIWVMNADGTGRTDVTPVIPSRTSHPADVAWSPDGLKLAYTNGSDTCNPNHNPGQVVMMNPDGTGPATVVCEVPFNGGSGTSHSSGGLSWSPDGQTITFEAPDGPDCEPDVWSVSPNGTGLTNLTNSTGIWDGNPDWSPSGSKLAFQSFGSCEGEEIWTMNANGTGKVRIAGSFSPSDPVESPVWAPDETKIAFTRGGTIWTTSPNGTGQVSLGVSGVPTSWQPILKGYPRPKGATPLRASLTLAYEPCTAPNRTHGPPLAYGSCNPPVQASGQATVGTFDSNMHPVRLEGSLRVDTLVGNPATPADEADVRFTFYMNDIRKKSDLSDYPGELLAKFSLQITDRDNTPYPGGPGPATTQQSPYSFTSPCATTADPAIGSTCQITTTADALAPGSVKEGRRSIWQMGRIEVQDGGTDGVGSTEGDNTLFADQGVFVP